MAATDPREFLSRALSHQAISAEELLAFIAANSDEKLTFDYKAGSLLKSKDERSKTIREYATAFANSDGGVLIVGVDDKTKSIDGCERIGSQPIDAWAKDCLAEVAGQFSPPPRLQIVLVEGKEVLLLAVARSPRLVPVIEARKQVFYIRLVDSNFPIPDFLLTDLVLGRREAPVLTPFVCDVATNESSFQHDKNPVAALAVCFTITVENAGLSSTRSLDVGLVTPTLSSAHRPLPRSLIPFVEISLPALNGRGMAVVPWRVTRASPQRIHRTDLVLPPFSDVALTLPAVHLPREGGRLSAAFYVVPEGCPPQWFQLQHLYSWRDSEIVRWQPSELTSLVECSGSLPMVSWSPEDG